MMIWCLLGFPTAGFKSAEPSAVPVMNGSTSAGRLRTTIQRHKNLPLPILILASRLRHCSPVSSGGEWLWSGDLAEILVIRWDLIEESIIIWQFICEFHFLCIFRYNYSKRPGERGKKRLAPSNQVFEFQSLKSTHGCVCHSHPSITSGPHTWSEKNNMLKTRQLVKQSIHV